MSTPVVCTLLLALGLQYVVGGGPWCFKCNNVFHPAGCSEVTSCGDHESCYTEKHVINGIINYNSDCKATVDCTTTVRRSTVTRCQECCTGTMCNENLCGADLFSNKTRLWCLNCDAQKDPAGCDHVTLCAEQESCSIVEKNFFGTVIYDLGCGSNCTGKTLTNDKQLCCDTPMCNSNLQGVAPENYIAPTTTPAPASATASIKEPSPVDYISHNATNDNVTLTCVVGGFPTPDVTWFFVPDVPPTTGTGNTTGAVTGPTGPSSVSTTAAVSTTVAANTAGSTTAGAAASTTAAAASTTAAAASTGGSSPGSTAVSAASTTGVSATQASTTTSPPGQDITSSASMANGVSTLTIMTPDAAVAGQYTCHAKNSQGSQDSSVNVTYSEAPIISGAENETVTSDVRKDVLLNCEASGSPTPNFTWVSPPNAGGLEKLKNGSLLIHNVHGDNTGVYKCVVQNSVGRDLKTFNLQVDDNSTAACPTQTVLMTTSGGLTTLALTSPTTATTTTATTTTASTTTTATTTTSTTASTASTTPTTTLRLTTTPLVCPTTPTTQSTTPTTPTTTPTTPPTTASTTSTSTTTSSSTATTIAGSTPPAGSGTTTSSTTATTLQPSSTTPATPYVTSQGPLVVDAATAGPIILQCSAHAPPGQIAPIVWSRLVENYDHSDTRTYTENGQGGVLVISHTGNTGARSGVYRCEVLGTNSSVDFAVYEEVPGPADCRRVFGAANASPGQVFKTTCGPCQPAVLQNSRLFWTDQICNNAVQRNVSQQTGGEVAWILKDNHEVELIVEDNNQLKFVA